jgi:hypothetical protein
MNSQLYAQGARKNLLSRLSPSRYCRGDVGTDRRSRTELLADAAKARRDAARHSIAAAIIEDRAVEETLRARAVELTSLAEMLEARAAKLARVAK